MSAEPFVQQIAKVLGGEQPRAKTGDGIDFTSTDHGAKGGNRDAKQCGNFA